MYFQVICDFGTESSISEIIGKYKQTRYTFRTIYLQRIETQGINWLPSSGATYPQVQQQHVGPIHWTLFKFISDIVHIIRFCTIFFHFIYNLFLIQRSTSVKIQTSLTNSMVWKNTWLKNWAIKDVKEKIWWPLQFYNF